MSSTNGHAPKKRAILYRRVRTGEQARSGYSSSLAQQREVLREYAARKAYEVIEERAEGANDA